jgi:hypothetical protein
MRVRTTVSGDFDPHWRPTDLGRFKAADFEVAMSGEGGGAAVRRVKFYARIRPEVDGGRSRKRPLKPLEAEVAGIDGYQRGGNGARIRYRCYSPIFS